MPAGKLRIPTEKSIVQPTRDEREEQLNKYDSPPTPPSTVGWFLLERIILRDENEYVLYGNHDGIVINAVLAPTGKQKGTYSIKGGLHQGDGVFLTAYSSMHPDFQILFKCKSKDSRGNELLWDVGLKEISQPHLDED